jgi:hypothetical protein
MADEKNSSSSAKTTQPPADKKYSHTSHHLPYGEGGGEVKKIKTLKP